MSFPGTLKSRGRHVIPTATSEDDDDDDDDDDYRVMEMGFMDLWMEMG